MAIMVHRTTLALDAATVSRIKTLSEIWGVSQAEVVRRSIEAAVRTIRTEQDRLLDRLDAYHSKGGLDPKAADDHLAEVAKDRASWRGEP